MPTQSRKNPGFLKRFFRLLWRSIKAFNTLVISLIFLCLLGGVLFVVFNQRGPTIPAGSALVLNPVGALVEQQTFVGAASLLQGNDLPQEALIKDITDALALAKDDNRIKLLVLKLDGLERGLLPKLERVARAIVDFKTSGKKVVAVSDNYSQSALFLAAQADEVLLNPEGMAIPEGFAMYNPFFKSFLDKHAVTVNLFKVGKYKSAADPFIRDSISVEDSEARLQILDAWWEAYTAEIEMARGMAAGSIDNMLQNAPEQLRSASGNLAQLSLRQGLVDRLFTASERRSYLIGLVGEDADTHNYRGVGYKQYLYAARLPLKPEAAKVAVITAVGNIVDGDAPTGAIGGRSLSKLIRKAASDDSVAAIVLRIDSGGGSKTASEIIRSELEAAQASGIPVVASMGSFAASGGYWIAASADEIWASPTTLTGSIGIFGLLPTFEKTLARYGIFSDGVTTTPIAGGASVMRGITPVYGEVLQTIIEAGYQQFLTTVADGRDMTVAAVHEIAQGRIWTGQKAQELGLVDKLGDLDQAISAAAKLANINDYAVWHVQPETSAEEKILRVLMESSVDILPKTTNNSLSQMAAMIHKELGFLKRLNDPNHAYVICGECVALP